MKRLTWKSFDGNSAYADMDGNMVVDYDTSSVLIGNVVEKLAEYEDLEEQGLLLRLPCRIEGPITAFGQTLKKEELLTLLYSFLGLKS